MPTSTLAEETHQLRAPQHTVSQAQGALRLSARHLRTASREKTRPPPRGAERVTLRADGGLPTPPAAAHIQPGIADHGSHHLHAAQRARLQRLRTAGRDEPGRLPAAPSPPLSGKQGLPTPRATRGVGQGDRSPAARRSRTRRLRKATRPQ